MALPPAVLPRFNFFAWLRNSFLAGVALVLPFVVTAWVIWLVVSIIDHNVVPLIPKGFRPYLDWFPGGGVIFALVALTLVGALAGNLFGRWIVNALDHFIAGLPLVRSIYGGAKQVFKQVAAPERTSFKEAVLVQFPMPGAWVLGFITNDDVAETSADTGEPLVAVYIPHAPIPTSGFLIYVARTALKPLTITPEQALQRVISLGIIKHDTDTPAK